MPEIKVNGVTLAYEVHGRGPSVVWSDAGLGTRGNLSYLLAGRLSARYRVLIWDRRNGRGASDIAIEDAPSDHDLWARDLHGLMEALHMSPAYLTGACAGASLSLLMAHRYPEQVRALALVAPPTHDMDLKQPIGNAMMLDHAAVAEEKGMEAVIENSLEAWRRVAMATPRPGSRDRMLRWIAQTISVRPTNRERLLAMNPRKFATIIGRWASWYDTNQFHGIPYDLVRTVTLPALVAHGFDPVHPRDAAEKLYEELPNAEWVEYSDRYTQEEMDQAGVKWALALPFIEEFLDRLEAA